jgi:hypothetical protein
MTYARSLAPPALPARAVRQLRRRRRAMSPNWVRVVRDVAVIILALESIIIGVVLVILALQVRSLVNLLQHEIKPILNSANETMGTVRGTTFLVSKGLVSPAINIISYGAAARRVFKIIFRGQASGKTP